ncbi:DUF3923 family protein [Staphylococcus pseudintermedius]|uniref:DUF3923 family protein n=1 Tax=Staphylococcus intermedius group TaxID=2815305 RepID=UPI000BBBFB00|nr:DUF3923 family protein [Staphylococcus delphini]EGQ0302940.1 DUF3923 family protein [Staphylococcus pseudintermedius]EGQ1296563.1 DUF3923 family protein [Staphylococcus pseudintermedius]EGQ1596660.1 DUF3923 family protein [Staphylococcus pseudintermedius]EGQ1787271.1 DUF3923 family protein [Staphylococcus pseudintermedius]EGQ2682214.1 DUF3923 family protein [Staphylococcus pseudintermedius]
MKVSWVLWWLFTILEVALFLWLSFLLWMREVDASGAVQTVELKWINTLVLGVGFLLPAIIQIIWLIFNIVKSEKRTSRHL